MVNETTKILFTYKINNIDYYGLLQNIPHEAYKADVTAFITDNPDISPYIPYEICDEIYIFPNEFNLDIICKIKKILISDIKIYLDYKSDFEFKLLDKNQSNWIPTQFIKTSNGEFKKDFNKFDIILYVNWENKSSKIKIQNTKESISNREICILDSSYILPINLDASQFPSYYNKIIKPLLKIHSESFEAYWNGDKWVGRFNDEIDCNSFAEKFKMEILIEDACRTSPEFDEIIDYIDYD